MNKDTVHHLFISAAIALFFSLSFLLGIFGEYAEKAKDPLYGRDSLNSDVVIIAIDEMSIQKIGRFPWNRSVYAKLLDKLPESAVAFDIAFSEVSSDDALLQEAINRHGKVILASEYTFDKGKELTTPVFQNASTGYINLQADNDGVVRSVNTVIPGNELLFAQTILTLASKKTLILSHERLLINSLDRGTIPSYSFNDILDGRVKPTQKIILVGATADNLHDSYLTPVAKQQQMPGVEIHANIVAMALDNRYLSYEHWIITICIIFILSFIFTSLIQRPWYSFLILVSVLLLYSIIAILLFDAGIILDMFYAPVAFVSAYILHLAYLVIVEKRERKRTLDAFSKYVSPKIIGELMKHPEKLKLGGERREITIFFSDIRGFTSVSEKLSPEALVDLLNEYLSAMTDIVIDSDGVIDKYMGDAIMAFWGAPLDEPKHSFLACDASLSMMKKLNELQKKWTTEGVPALDIGIGLNTGHAVIGNMGSNKRFDYTCMGDTINLGSRLEGLNKEYGTHIIIGENTRKAIGSAFVVRELDRVAVKGKKEPITIYELVGRTASDDVKKVIAFFQEGLRLYRHVEFDKAQLEFTKGFALNNDATCQIFIDRCKYLIDHPMEKDWNGVWVMKTK